MSAALPYHRLARLSPRSARWWTPLTTLAVGVGMFAALAVPLFAVSIVWALLAEPGAPGVSANLDDPNNPFDWVASLGLIALMLPAVLLGVRWGGFRRGTTHSVTGRFRWRLMARAAVWVVPVYVVVVGASAILSPPDDFRVPPIDATFVLILVIILALGPLQCAAEEYAFRGLPQQLLGTWLRSPLWGILLPVPLFVMSHGYSWAGQVQIAIFALATGFLVWKSGGLELSVLVHTANNLTLFVLAPFSPSSMRQGEVDPVSVIVYAPITLAITAGLTWWVSRQFGVRFFEPVRGRGRVAEPAAPAPVEQPA